MHINIISRYIFTFIKTSEKKKKNRKITYYQYNIITD